MASLGLARCFAAEIPNIKQAGPLIMLKTVIGLCLCPSCQDANGSLTATAFRETDREVIDGILRCANCGGVFPMSIACSILSRLPLLDLAVLEDFERHYAGELKAIQYERPRGAGAVHSQANLAAQLKQRIHFDNYADGVVQRYDDYASMSFWRAVDAWTFERWHELIDANELLLDVGCADGRSSFPHLPRNIVVGFDISRKMIRRAIDTAVARGYEGRFTFFVSDGSSLPFKTGSFQYVQTYGVLHHLPNPGAVTRDIQRVLKGGGIHFVLENNATVFRPLFDWLMKVVPIWHEEAGEEALISRQMVEAWVEGLPARIDSGTIVFLPPHMFNFLPPKSARRLLDVTNRLLGKIPGIKQNGGLIVFRIQKPRG